MLGKRKRKLKIKNIKKSADCPVVRRQVTQARFSFSDWKRWRQYAEANGYATNF